jgi:hypothetical protein
MEMPLTRRPRMSNARGAAWLESPVSHGPLRYVLYFPHGNGQTHTRSAADDVDPDDRVADRRKPSLLSPPEPVVREQGFDDFVEAQCVGFYAEMTGCP